MSTAIKTYNNIMADGGWEIADNSTDYSLKGGIDMQAKFLVINAQVEVLTKGNIVGARTEGQKKTAGGTLTRRTKPT